MSSDPLSSLRLEPLEGFLASAFFEGQLAGIECKVCDIFAYLWQENKALQPEKTLICTLCRNISNNLHECGGGSRT
jgi:hypothetical protein